jgi:transposase
MVMGSRAIEIRRDRTPARLRVEARQAGCSRAAARMCAVAHALEGMSRTRAAELAGLSVQALRDIVLRYNAQGLTGFYDKPRSGRPRKLDAAQEQDLAATITAGPDPEQDGISAYTLEDLAGIVAAKWQVAYHPSSMSRVVQRLGFSRQKARPSHPKKDPAAAAAFKKSSGRAEKDCRYT